MKQATLIPAGEQSGALFSPCCKWRYSLWRLWREDALELAATQNFRRCVAFIGLNPSTADEEQNDPTVRRCIGFAKDWGFGGLLMLNLYGFRATDPRVMKRFSEPVGPETDHWLAFYAARVGRIVACFGSHAAPARVAELKRVINRRMDCLGTTISGMPKHPLYLLGATPLSTWWEPAAEGTGDRGQGTGINQEAEC